MPRDGLSEGYFSRTELGELAELFDRFHFAFDPTDETAAQAELEFNRKVRDVFEKLIRFKHPQVPFDAFLGRVRAHCWEYLKKNKP